MEQTLEELNQIMIISQTNPNVFTQQQLFHMQENLENLFKLQNNVSIFQQQNIQAVQKIVKKFNKNLKKKFMKFNVDTSQLTDFTLIESSYYLKVDQFLKNCNFISKAQIDQIKEEIYNYFSKIFQVSLDDAKKHLQQFCTTQQIQVQSKTDFQLMSSFSKIIFGINIMLLLSLISLITDQNVQRQELTLQQNGIRLFYSVTLIWLMFKFMIYVCTKQKINYSFILELPSTNLDQNLQIIDMVISIYTLVLTILILLSIGNTFQSEIDWPLPFGDFIQKVDSLQESMQWLSYIPILTSFLILIQTIVSFIGFNKGFIHIQSVLYKVFTPWRHSVSFPLFYTADCLTSCGTLLKDIVKIMAINAPDYSLMIIEMIPQLIRFIQCLKKYHDEKLAYPHLLNAGKYLSGVIATLNNLNVIEQNKPAFIIFSIVKGIEQAYKFYYDIWQDFALLSGGTGAEQFKDQKQKWKYGKLCRRPTMLSKSFIICSIIFDFCVRLTFLINILYPQGEQNWFIQTLVCCYLEVIRRFVWSIIRIDNQMATNCENYLTCKIVPIIQRETDKDPEFKQERLSMTQIKNSVQQTTFQNTNTISLPSISTEN